MRIAYVTVSTPLGNQETFILPELNELIKNNHEVRVFPLRPKGHFEFSNAINLSSNTYIVGLFDFKVLWGGGIAIIRSPLNCFKVISHMFFQSRNVKIRIKNLAVVLKAFYFAKFFKVINIQHIHAHWGTTTATFAFIISKLTGIPWSFTVHRWDIYEDNILKLKIHSASFVRCISNKGRDDLLRIVGNEYWEKIRVIYLGVETPNIPVNKMHYNNTGNLFKIITPANLYTVKGHKYLIDAAEILVKNNFLNFRCFFYGDGYLFDEIKSDIKNRNLDEFIYTPGRITHDQLLNKYAKGEADLVVLPSITTNSGQHEGIPVALIEAMAHFIPVVSTNTGSVSELIGNGEGLMVNQKDGIALAHAIRSLAENRTLYISQARRGYQKVKNEFDIKLTTQNLIDTFTRS